MNPNDEVTTSEWQSKQFVVFQLHEEEYATEVLSVAEVVPMLEITPVPDAPAYILGIVNLRGKVLPILDLEKKFHLDSTEPSKRQHIMIAESQQKIQFGILVDHVKEVIKISEQAIQPSPEILGTKIDGKYLPGVIILEDDSEEKTETRMILILDMQEILSDKNMEQVHAVIHQKVNITQPQHTKKETK